MNQKPITTDEEITQRISELTKTNQLLQKEIADRLRVETEMQSTINQFQVIADSAPVFIAQVNAQTLLYEFVNSPFASSYNLPREKILGNHIREILGEENYQFAQDYIARVKTGETVYYENTFKKDHESIWLHVKYSPIFDVKGQVISFIVISAIMTEQKQANEKIKSLLAEKETLLKEMEKLAITDPLTGAFNRRHFCEVGIREMARSKRTGFPVSLIMFDLDHFKRINDTMGHSIGDEVLKTVVACLHPALRENDTLARLGGEEFYILMPDTNDRDAELAAERFRTLIANIDTVQVTNDTLHFTASFGVSQLALEIIDFDEFLKQADNALYQAKAQGRNCVVRYQ